MKRFERSGRGQEPSRGHKFSILENVVLHRDFTSQTLASFPSDLVGVALVGATGRHIQCNHLRLTSHNKALALNIDGEILYESTYDIRLMPARLWLCIPRPQEEVAPVDHSQPTLDCAAGAGL